MNGNSSNGSNDSNCSTPGKRKFDSQAAADSFEKDNRAQFGGPLQYVYACEGTDHFHLSSHPPFIPGAPQRSESSSWMAASIPEPVARSSQSDRILTALRNQVINGVGTKTVKEIAAECDCTDLAMIYTIAKAAELPYLRGRNASYGGTPTLQTIQSKGEAMLAELAALDEQEIEFKRLEEEKKKVQLQICDAGENILISASGQHLRLTPDQYSQLQAKMAGFAVPAAVAA